MSDNAYINDLEERNAELRRELAEAKEHIERMTKPWRFELITLPVPRKQEPGDYPDLSESYELSLVDTGYSERVYLLGSNELDKRINDLQSQLTAANATIAACKEAGGGAIAKIAAERLRQVSAEGYAHEHDDQHTGGQLAAAAADYASPYEIRARSLVSGTFDANVYPTGWRKKVGLSRIDELVKAGALIVAEIERLERSTPSSREKGQQ